jgi:hypothetical protein
MTIGFIFGSLVMGFGFSIVIIGVKIIWMTIE